MASLRHGLCGSGDESFRYQMAACPHYQKTAILEKKRFSMNVVRKRKLIMLIMIVTILSTATALVLFALQQNINLFYAPADIVAGKAPLNHPIQIGRASCRERVLDRV